jgi:hypothetical protein
MVCTLDGCGYVYSVLSYRLEHPRIRSSRQPAILLVLVVVAADHSVWHQCVIEEGWAVILTRP